MKFDDFLSSPRWEILQLIAGKSMSPIELAEALNTTVSYISQQLKLLDAAGLVLKEKTGAAEKGKPRTLFTISSEILYLTALTKSFSEKKLVSLTDYHKSIINIWRVGDSSLHLYFEKLFWKIHENLKEVKAIFIENSAVPKFLVLSDSKTLKSKIDSYLKSFDKKIECSFITKNALDKIPSEKLLTLYVGSDFLTELKGGEK